MSSPFASQSTHTISLPSDPDQSIVIRRLPGRHLNRAQQENLFSSSETVRRMGGARFQRELREAVSDEDGKKKVEASASDPLNGFDRYTLLAHGIVSWTYPESLEPSAFSGLEEAEAAVKAGDLKLALKFAVVWAKDGADLPRVAAIDDLGEEEGDYIAREILRLSKPSLFQTKAEAEAETKNV
jgi:hypothetical protein